MAGQQTLQDYLAGPVMTELLSTYDVKIGLPPVPVPDLMKKSPVDAIVNMQVMYNRFTGFRGGSQLTNPYSPSRRVEQTGVTREFQTAQGSRENFVLDSDWLTAMQSGIPLYTQRAKEVFVDRMKNFKVRIENMQNMMVMSGIINGQMWSDVNGNILPSSAGAYCTVNFNLNYQTGGTPGPLIKTTTYPNMSVTVGDWSSASTDIEQSLRSLRQSHISVSNYNPKIILYGVKIPSYLANNTSLQTYMSRGVTMGNQYLGSNEVPPNLGDYTWIPAYNNYYIDQNGVYQKWIADNQVIVLPEIDDSWYEFYEASVLIPNTIVAPGMSIEQLIGATRPVKGYASYVELMTDPIAGKVIQSWYGMPTQKGVNLNWSITVS